MKFLLLVLFPAGLWAQSPQRDVVPSDTDPHIQVVHGPHRVSAPTAGRRNKLVVALTGTGSNADGFDAFNAVAAAEGFHTISLDYKNEVITTICRPSEDLACYDSFRKEIAFGTPVSDKVQVDSMNSIYHRLVALLTYLAKNSPSEGWDQFMSGGKINWHKVTTVGHSQGAGHAAYFSKHFALDRAIILAGPQDYLDKSDRVAPWVGEKGQTPGSKLRALLHPDDPYGFTKQLKACLLLTGLTDKSTQSAEDAVLKAPILVTHIGNDNPHGSVMLPAQKKAWVFLLEN